MSTTRESHRSIVCGILSGRDDPFRGSSSTLDRWQGVLGAAREEGVLPLVRHSFSRAGWPESMPQVVRQKLRRGSLAVVAANNVYYRELARILAAIAEVGNTEVAVLKGAALASTLYADPGLRPMGDLDLLLRPEGLASALSTLRDLGYGPIFPEIGKGWNESVGHAVTFRGGPYGRVLVDLHSRLVAGEADWRSPPLTWIWDRMEHWKKPSPLAGACGLSRTAQLLYLAAHLVLQHGAAEARLIWYYDLHLLAQAADRIDWDELLRRAHELRWAAAVRVALEGCRRQLGTPFPERLLEELDRRVEPSARRVVATMMDPVQTRATQLWNQTRCLTWPARLRLLARHVFPSPAYLRWRYRFRSSWLWPLGYPYRWLVIVREGVSTLGKQMHRAMGASRIGGALRLGGPGPDGDQSEEGGMHISRSWPC